MTKKKASAKSTPVEDTKVRNYNVLLELNKTEFIGRLTRVPDVYTTPSGIIRTTLAIAVNSTWVDSSGEQKEGVDYIRVVLWNARAQAAAKLPKGVAVYIEGRLSSREIEETKRTLVEVQCKKFKRLSFPAKAKTE